VTVAAIRESVAHAKGRVLPGQHLDPDAHLAFAARFGPPTEGSPGHSGNPATRTSLKSDYTKLASQRHLRDVVSRRQGIDWHTDATFVKRPPLGRYSTPKGDPTFRRGYVVVRPRRALADLSPSLPVVSIDVARRSRRPRGLQEHPGAGRQGSWTARSSWSWSPSCTRSCERAPRDRREGSLRQSGIHFTHRRIDCRESDALLNFLYHTQFGRSSPSCDITGSGDVGFWDNRSTQHAVVVTSVRSIDSFQRVTLRRSTSLTSMRAGLEGSDRRKHELASITTQFTRRHGW